MCQVSKGHEKDLDVHQELHLLSLSLLLSQFYFFTLFSRSHYLTAPLPLPLLLLLSCSQLVLIIPASWSFCLHLKQQGVECCVYPQRGASTRNLHIVALLPRHPSNIKRKVSELSFWSSFRNTSYNSLAFSKYFLQKLVRCKSDMPSIIYDDFDFLMEFYLSNHFQHFLQFLVNKRNSEPDSAYG